MHRLEEPSQFLCGNESDVIPVRATDDYRVAVLGHVIEQRLQVRASVGVRGFEGHAESDGSSV